MQWYYSKNGKQLGPVSQSDLISKISSGEVTPSDLVWRDGMADWLPSAQVSELRALASSAGNANQPTSTTPEISTTGQQANPYNAPNAAPNAYPNYPVAPTAPNIAGKAQTSMTLGIVAIVTGVLCGCLGGLPCGILAIVFGNQYKKAAQTDPSLQPALGKAKSGILMGWIGIVLALILTVVGVIIQIAAVKYAPESNGLPVRQQHMNFDTP